MTNIVHLHADTAEPRPERRRAAGAVLTALARVERDMAALALAHPGHAGAIGLIADLAAATAFDIEREAAHAGPAPVDAPNRANDNRQGGRET
ncbi:MAG: hypothetical protein HQL35_15470 [Alphaproteobacteria bacterium]|nr:hypothetical protein [Alphaproteobacteria bacterium]